MPTEIIGIEQPPVQVEVEVIPPVELVAKTSGSNTSGNEEVKNEVPTGAINGSNAVFTSQHLFVPGSVQVYLNGVRQKIVDDFNTSGNNTIQMVVSPNTGEIILIDYEKLI